MPDRAKNSSVTEPEAAAKRGLANRPTGIIGWLPRTWAATNAAIAAMLRAARPPVAADSQPAAGAWISV